MPTSNHRERRVAPRLKTFEPADVIDASGMRRRAHLLNISATGALVHSSDAPGPGSIITIRAGFDLGRARVAWRSANAFGVAFLTPVCEHQLSRIAEAQRRLVESSAKRAAVR